MRRMRGVLAEHGVKEGRTHDATTKRANCWPRSRSTPSTTPNAKQLKSISSNCPHCQSELDALREVAGVLGKLGGAATRETVDFASRVASTITATSRRPWPH